MLSESEAKSCPLQKPRIALSTVFLTPSSLPDTRSYRSCKLTSYIPHQHRFPWH